MNDRWIGVSEPFHSSGQHLGVGFRVTMSDAEATLNRNEPQVQVRCLACDRRLFDVFEVRRFHFQYGMVPNGSLRIERKCPSCKRKNRGVVTASPGDPLTNGSVLEGRWLCPCGKYLGHVDAIRGRMKMSCDRCHAEVRSVAAGAIAVASVPTRPVSNVPDIEPLVADPLADDPFADLTA